MASDNKCLFLQHHSHNYGPSSLQRTEGNHGNLKLPDTSLQRPVDMAQQSPIQQQVDTVQVNVYVLKALKVCDFQKSQR